jgi:hypothetical protein
LTRIVRSLGAAAFPRAILQSRNECSRLASPILFGISSAPLACSIVDDCHSSRKSSSVMGVGTATGGDNQPRHLGAFTNAYGHRQAASEAVSGCERLPIAARVLPGSCRRRRWSRPSSWCLPPSSSLSSPELKNLMSRLPANRVPCWTRAPSLLQAFGTCHAPGRSGTSPGGVV